MKFNFRNAVTLMAAVMGCTGFIAVMVCVTDGFWKGAVCAAAICIAAAFVVGGLLNG